MWLDIVAVIKFEMFNTMEIRDILGLMTLHDTIIIEQCTSLITLA